MILTSAPAAVAVAAMGMLVFSITGKSKSKSNMVANVSMSHMELLTQSKIRHILVQLQTVAS
jgi:methylthioribose-1-phosphate isomerase